MFGTQLVFSILWLIYIPATCIYLLVLFTYLLLTVELHGQPCAHSGLVAILVFEVPSLIQRPWHLRRVVQSRGQVVEMLDKGATHVISVAAAYQ